MYSHCLYSFRFFLNDTATTEIYTLSLHDALPIFQNGRSLNELNRGQSGLETYGLFSNLTHDFLPISGRSEERFSRNAETELVCRLLLEKNNTRICIGSSVAVTDAVLTLSTIVQ